MRNRCTSLRPGARSAAKRRLANGLAVGLGPLCAAVVSLSSFAASSLDDSIVVRGNRRIEAAAVRGYFHPGRGAADRPRAIRGQQAVQGQGAYGRGPLEGPYTAEQGQRAGRRLAHRG